MDREASIIREREWKGRFKEWWLLLFPFLTLVILEVVFWLVPLFDPKICTITLQAHFWSSTMLILFIESRCYCLRSNGYLAIHKKLSYLIVSSPVILAVGNSALLVFWSLWPPNRPSDIISRKGVIHLLISCEILGTIPVLITYFSKLQI
eukprot:TRINITY_DN2028_c0_g1_i1.p1 TRINITY_DN2028_c0_g1~~TRINITY_DN2028_c0_g1_i1.p1  ORF type:complete len:150 (-),score=5.77 TRINITY_DN2028_c0_g1_i1:433-882(-)